MPKARINGVELHYEEGGTGAPVVYVHGGYAGVVTRVDPGEWDWERDLATHFRFISYDRRGCYRSDFADHGLEPINQAKDLEGLLDYLGIHATHVIGSSAGGPIALLFTATRPDRVRSLILTGTALDLFPPDNITSAVRERVRVLEAQGTEVAYETRPSGVVASMEELWRKKDAEARGRPDEFLEFQRRLTVRAEGLRREALLGLFAAELRNLKVYLDLGLLPCAQRITAPVLVLHGGNDHVVPPSWGETLAQAIPKAQWVVVPGAGHGLWTHERLRHLAIAFIRTHEPVQPR